MKSVLFPYPLTLLIWTICWAGERTEQKDTQPALIALLIHLFKYLFNMRCTHAQANSRAMRLARGLRTIKDTPHSAVALFNNLSKYLSGHTCTTPFP